MSASLFWFRRDLRLTDNPGLNAAAGSGGPVYAVFCLDELEKVNARQRAFAIGSLRALRTVLDKRDATLTLVRGSPSEALAHAAQRLDATAVYCSRSYSRSERAVESEAVAALRRSDIALHMSKGDVVHEPEAVAELKQSEGEGYRVFPPFFAAWQSLDVAVPSGEVIPNGRDEHAGALPEDDTAPPVPAGEAAARSALERFVTARAADYIVSGQYPATDGTSGLAPYLRFGCVSPRVVHQAMARRMAWSWTLAQERRSMAAFMRQLALRDFFIQLAYFVPALHDEALQEKMRSFPWSTGQETLESWRKGRTGYPFVDAAMRQLSTQGLVHQRAAICAASFSCFDLGLDWRMGRDVWMDEYLAADEALCDGNWQWLAGVGSDQAAYPRIYNPEKQARQFDAQAVYLRRWVPELRKLPTAAALAPWRMDRQHQIELSFFTPDQYPQPIVDHELAAREFLKRYRAFREA
ncbi:MAG TPA: deoxyribodipyrimidine photo-lyase [Candidatus Eremiobacteraceae bacterium]|jgi:deoxyribodipyrimidine photo-lyase|nr:deoxyribodipyrimidine photo-lyase [Candidatus Eremiobacteraceae bacterium]